MKTEPGKNINQYLAEIKGWTPERAKQMNDYVTGLAKEVGLTYNFDKAIVANSFDAHRFSHLAKKYGLQDLAEERLFAAYFTEGKNTADHQTLVELGEEIGLDPQEVRSILQSNLYADEVYKDIEEAERIGVTGVPFFVFNRRYAVSGAQPPETFLEILNKSFDEWKIGNPLPSLANSKE
jgi:predicted DsbA family dithiol-disulfide isomerase